MYRAGSEPTVLALEVRAGIIAGHWAAQASVLVARMTPQECADTLRELGNMSPSRSTLDRLATALSTPFIQWPKANHRPVRTARIVVYYEVYTEKMRGLAGLPVSPLS